MPVFSSVTSIVPIYDLSSLLSRPKISANIEKHVITDVIRPREDPSKGNDTEKDR